MNAQAEVSFRQLNSCLLNLPSALVNPLLQTNILLQSICIELSWSDSSRSNKSSSSPQKIFYSGWSGHFSNQANTIEIDPNFAHSLGLREGKKINVKVLLDLPKIISVELEPETSSDWEITELHAQFIEDRLLNQVRCVSKNQLVLAFPNGNTVVKYIVKSIKSESGELSHGMLITDSELHIAPKVYRRASSTSTTNSNGGTRQRRSVSSRRSSSSSLLPAVILRNISLPHTKFPTLSKLNNPYEIFVNFNQPSVYPQLKNSKYVQLTLIPGPGTPARAVNKTGDHPSTDARHSPFTSPQNSSTTLRGSIHNSNEMVEAKKVTAILTHSPLVGPGQACISEFLAVALGLEKRVGDFLCIEIAPAQLEKLHSNTIVIHKYVTHTLPASDISIKHNSLESKKEQKQRQDRINKEFHTIFNDKNLKLWSSPLTNGIKLPKIEGFLPLGGFLQFKKESKLAVNNWCIFESLGELPKVETGEDVLRAESFIPQNKLHSTEENDQNFADEGDEEVLKEELIGQKQILKDVVKTLQRNSESGVLLYGASGSGKTLLSRKISKMAFDMHGFFVKYIACENLSLSNISNLKNQILEIFNEISWHSPSLLILENLDTVIPAEMENADSSSSRQISELLVSQLSKLMSQRKVSLLVTAKSKEAINAIVFQTHLIEDDFQLRPPDKELRKELFKHYLSKLNVGINEHSELLNDIGVETEGYLPSDLKVLVDRSYHDLISQTLENEDENEDTDDNDLDLNLNLQWENVEKALDNYTPSSLRGAKLQKSSVSWDDIGGLKEAKSILLETLEWPTKYAPIFANCPLRLRSGILLYGYPGCGKTLLASALAAQCGLNFISIKGPEILNKYIGASEQSVRELFERAQAAKPCILFFDEFDSIAPKRGHDSTGVTDRVVNQMLTQMDGAEGLDGVYVLAATSRPDLIDSALLRPGRLDKSVICDVPNYEDRLDILKCVTRTMNLAAEVSLEEVAKSCQGFSGADLQGLAYNAYLKAVHDKLESLQLETSDQHEDTENTMPNNIDFFQVTEAVSAVKQTKSNVYNERVKMSAKLSQIFLAYSSASSSANPKGDKPSNAKLQEQVVITKKDFLHSLSETKSSISQSELKKLQKIYDQFLNGRDGNLPDGQPSNEIGGRTTLM